ncbi:MAG TPA: hypothetical protein DEO32_01545 [Ruminococcaceae bacterium]|nr:hypothetical protein [Oscillospiraceae bacterium]
MRKLPHKTRGCACAFTAFAAAFLSCAEVCASETAPSDIYNAVKDNPQPEQDFYAAVPLIIAGFSAVIVLLTALMIIRAVHAKKNNK